MLGIEDLSLEQLTIIIDESIVASDDL